MATSPSLRGDRFDRLSNPHDLEVPLINTLGNLYYVKVYVFQNHMPNIPMAVLNLEDEHLYVDGEVALCQTTLTDIVNCASNILPQHMRAELKTKSSYYDMPVKFFTEDTFIITYGDDRSAFATWLAEGASNVRKMEDSRLNALLSFVGDQVAYRHGISSDLIADVLSKLYPVDDRLSKLFSPLLADLRTSLIGLTTDLLTNDQDRVATDLNKLRATLVAISERSNLVSGANPASVFVSRVLSSPVPNVGKDSLIKDTLTTTEDEQLRAINGSLFDLEIDDIDPIVTGTLSRLISLRATEVVTRTNLDDEYGLYAGSTLAYPQVVRPYIGMAKDTIPRPPPPSTPMFPQEPRPKYTFTTEEIKKRTAEGIAAMLQQSNVGVGNTSVIHQHPISHSSSSASSSSSSSSTSPSSSLSSSSSSQELSQSSDLSSSSDSERSADQREPSSDSELLRALENIPVSAETEDVDVTLLEAELEARLKNASKKERKSVSFSSGLKAQEIADEEMSEERKSEEQSSTSGSEYSSSSLSKYEREDSEEFVGAPIDPEVLSESEEEVGSDSESSSAVDDYDIGSDDDRSHIPQILVSNDEDDDGEEKY